MDAVTFLQNLLQINSSNPPGNEHAVAQLFAERAKRTGLDMKITEVETGRTNVEIYFGRNKNMSTESRKKILLCGHMDTVTPGELEWNYPPFSGEIVGDKLYGRGASDMKSGLAAMYLALEALQEENAPIPGDIVFLATAGEEVDCCGARKYLESNRMSDFNAIIIGEPTDEKIVVGHKGALWLEIEVLGKTAHGAMPDLGINAIQHMTHVISLIEEFQGSWQVSKEPLGQSSIAVTKIQGGIQTNVIPDRCYLHVDIRTVPPQSHDELLSRLQQELDKLEEMYEVGLNMKKLLDRPSLLTSTSSDIIMKALRLKGLDSSAVYGVSYYTDGSVLNPQSDIETLIYGPGNENLAHQPNEWVDIHAYVRAIDFYKQLIKTYFNAA